MLGELLNNHEINEGGLIKTRKPHTFSGESELSIWEYI